MEGPLYAPTGPANLPFNSFERLSISKTDFPNRETYSATAKPKVMGTAC